MSTINEGWSARPASGSGHAQAAPPTNHQRPSEAPAFTIDGYTPEQLRAQAAERARQRPEMPDTVEAAHNAITGTRRAFQAHLDEIRAEAAHLTPEGVEARIAAFAETDAVKQINASVDAVRQMRDAAAAEVERIRSGLVQPGDAAQETRNSRTWQRAQRQLDAAEDGKLGTTALDLLRKAPRDQLGVLIEELPSFLQAKGIETDWLDKGIQENPAAADLVQAQAAARAAERSYEVINYNASAMRKGIEDGRVPTQLVDPKVVG